MPTTANLLKLPYRPLKGSYAYDNSSHIVSTQLDGGQSKGRLDVIGGTSIVNVEWFLRPAEFQFFMAFYNTVAGKGSRKFKTDLILDKPYIQEFICKFVPDSLQVREPSALSYRITANFEVSPIDDSAYDFAFVLYTLDPVGTDNLLDSIGTFVNSDLDIFGL